ncbi:hypothetical protein BBW68_06905 [Candidatus Erwinia dacicola]|uniref:Uncharacterized protein n=1 Tax=Candidatus Erwinia dacicola TaxID=252393 RepID=A0A1E7Z2R4_9GAMM|nr:hypothetical protein BBW68_06905 [Candidatus Erwinia dacicola]
MIILDMPIKRSLRPVQYTQVQDVMQRLDDDPRDFLRKWKALHGVLHPDVGGVELFQSRFPQSDFATR